MIPHSGHDGCGSHTPSQLGISCGSSVAVIIIIGCGSSLISWSQDIESRRSHKGASKFVVIIFFSRRISTSISSGQSFVSVTARVGPAKHWKNDSLGVNAFGIQRLSRPKVGSKGTP